MFVGCGLRVAGRDFRRSRRPTSNRQPPTANLRRGSALILSLVIAAVLALMATAFLITTQVEGQAAANTLRGGQAEAACRAGLAAAIYRVEISAGLYAADPGHLPDWHSHFFNAAGPDLCPPSWVDHYGTSFTNGAMVAREFELTPGDKLKSQKGFRAKYYVAVADLDGKLHCNPASIANLLDGAGTQSMLAAMGLSAGAVAVIAGDHHPRRAPGELRLPLVPVVPAAEWNDAEKFLTVYPRVTAPDPLAAGSISLANSRVNVNTARIEVLAAILSQVPNLAAGHAAALATHLTGRRPFGGRGELEDALYAVGPAGALTLPITADRLSETEFNNVLNSLNGTEPSIYATDGDVPTRKTGNSGLYRVQFSGGAYAGQASGTTDATGPGDCWGAEVKFTSRFFHVYVLGRTVSQEGSGRVLAERRLHAVYDAGAHKTLWLRWNFGAKANMTD
ncbi:MAG TPA: hypothetical protein PK280_15400 [Planctomycetota bacterium]|nr:hypothetical protein [Planctomycetota bacterium]